MIAEAKSREPCTTTGVRILGRILSRNRMRGVLSADGPAGLDVIEPRHDQRLRPGDAGEDWQIDHRDGEHGIGRGSGRVQQ